MSSPRIAVLDVDGTLVDSNYQHALAWYRALRSLGETYPIWRIHRLIGMGGDNLLTELAGADVEARIGDVARERQGKEVDALLDEAEDIVNLAAPDILSEFEKKNRKRRIFRRKKKK
jgi:phosphoglycolate phosphatase-like HAD superfamily hydrolase